MAEPIAARPCDVRLEWGPVGARAVGADVTVVVDVLSFSTSVTVAVECGMRVFPYRWDARAAVAFAAECDAFLALGRHEPSRGGAAPAPSLSPAALLACRPVPRIVLPSPNGSTIAAAVHEEGGTVAVGCLRNAAAVATWLGAQLGSGHTVAVVAAGERWALDGSLRPALEDHLGAGAILARLAEGGHAARFSAEAAAAVDLFGSGRRRLQERVLGCVSGRELIDAGFGDDVTVAAALDSSTVVPVLIDGAFSPAP